MALIRSWLIARWRVKNEWQFIAMNDTSGSEINTPEDVHQAFYRQKTVNLYQDWSVIFRLAFILRILSYLRNVDMVFSNVLVFKLFWTEAVTGIVAAPEIVIAFNVIKH